MSRTLTEQIAVVMLGFAGVVAGAAVGPASADPLPYGPDTCASGYVPSRFRCGTGSVDVERAHDHQGPDHVDRDRTTGTARAWLDQEAAPAVDGFHAGVRCSRRLGPTPPLRVRGHAAHR